jgi:hypothetical protein
MANKLELFEVKQIIKQWINSCKHEWQVDLFPKFINEFILPQFENEPDYGQAKFELQAAINDRKKLISQPEGDNHRSNHLNEIP